MTILLCRDASLLPPLPGPVSATLGNFDGVHRGHQQLLEAVARRAKRDGGTGVAISFYPPPAVVLGKAPSVRVITTPWQKLALFGQAGIDVLYLIHFTEQRAAMTAAEFIDHVLFGALNVTHLVLGPDAGVGRGRQGDVPFISGYFTSKGKTVEVVPPLLEGEERISSRRVRALLEEGAVKEAAVLLGRNYAISARVRPGDQRGTRIGIPTANLHVPSQVVPRSGVYATRARLGEQSWMAVTNVGRRPTFGVLPSAVETHLIDYHGGSLYGCRVEVEFVDRLRGEQVFPDHHALVVQIKRDIERARKL